MFTGIIKTVGKISRLERQGGDVHLQVAADGLPWEEYEVGESIAVNGVCLTATKLHKNGFETDVSVETLNVTSLQSIEVGSSVNLEPAISLGDRLGGHIVSGHVDCTGEISSLDNDARSMRLVVSIPREYARFVAKKGSVCVDGVSLTVNRVEGSEFALNIIPHTAQSTIIADYNVGTIVNIEVDLLARYVERLMGGDEGVESSVSKEFLKAHGYVE